QLKASLEAQAMPPVKTKKGSYDYFLVRAELDSLSRILLKAGQVRENFAVHFLDRKTLVFADLGPMTQFLALDRKPSHITEPPASPSGGGMTGVPPGGGMTGVAPGRDGPPAPGVGLPPKGGAGSAPPGPVPPKGDGALTPPGGRDGPPG